MPQPPERMDGFPPERTERDDRAGIARRLERDYLEPVLAQYLGEPFVRHVEVRIVLHFPERARTAQHESRGQTADRMSRS